MLQKPLHIELHVNKRMRSTIRTSLRRRRMHALLLLQQSSHVQNASVRTLITI